MEDSNRSYSKRNNLSTNIFQQINLKTEAILPGENILTVVGAAVVGDGREKFCRVTEIVVLG